MRLPLALAALLALAGCAAETAPHACPLEALGPEVAEHVELVGTPSPVVHVAIDPTMPAELAAEHLRGCDLWRGMQGLRREVVCEVRPAREGDVTVTLDPELEARGFYGWHDRGRILVATGVPAPYAATNLAHELGHLLGLGHVGAGIMGAPAEGEAWTADDRAECTRVGACD